VSNFDVNKAKKVLDDFSQKCEKKSYYDLNNSLQCLMFYKDLIVRNVPNSELSLEFDHAISKAKEILLNKAKNHL
jgi:hypothetical protein